jgi:hypothetical protein
LEAVKKRRRHLEGSSKNSDFDKCEELGFRNDADSETSFFHYSLIWAEDAERLGVIREGTIDSNYGKRHGQKTLAFKRCKFVDIKSVRLVNAPNYNTSGISLTSVDGGNIEGVLISNVAMHNACCPVFIRRGSRCRDHAPSAGSLRNVSISHLVALNASWTSSITGIPGYYPEGITLSDIRLVYPGGGPLGTKPGEPVPEQEKEYPTAKPSGIRDSSLPARVEKDLLKPRLLERRRRG